VTSATELFKKQSWFAVFMGQFIEPQAYHPLVDSRPNVDAAGQLAATAQWVERVAERMPTHAEFIARNAAAPAETMIAAE
jgi:tryptophan halogenase